MVKDKIFLLSGSELQKYLRYLPMKKHRKCKYKGEYEWWWLRSPGSFPGMVAIVNVKGILFHDSHGVLADRNSGIRPAMYISPMYLATLKRTKKGYIQFGGKKWLVLDEESGLLLSKGAVDVRPFDKVSNNYENSDIRKYLNDELFNELFSNEEQKLIRDTIIDCEASRPAA